MKSSGLFSEYRISFFVTVISASLSPDQSLLLPPDVRAWLPEGHLAHHVSDLVDGLDLTAFYAPYEGDGRRNAPYDPRMMVKVLLYAYATGVFSSRGIARALEEDVAFRVLAAGNFPQHRTLCEFRRRHLDGAPDGCDSHQVTDGRRNDPPRAGDALRRRCGKLRLERGRFSSKGVAGARQQYP